MATSVFFHFRFFLSSNKQLVFPPSPPPLSETACVVASYCPVSIASSRRERRKESAEEFFEALQIIHRLPTSIAVPSNLFER